MFCCWKKRSTSDDHQVVKTPNPISQAGNSPSTVVPGESIPAPTSDPASSVAMKSVPATFAPSDTEDIHTEERKTGNGSRERSDSVTSFYSARSSRSSRSGDDYYSVCSGYGVDDSKNT